MWYDIVTFTLQWNSNKSSLGTHYSACKSRSANSGLAKKIYVNDAITEKQLKETTMMTFSKAKYKLHK